MKNNISIGPKKPYRLSSS